MCACWCLRDAHRRWNDTDYCGRCGCDHYRPVRLHWWQLWRPRAVLGELTPDDLRLLYQLPEEIT